MTQSSSDRVVKKNQKSQSVGQVSSFSSNDLGDVGDRGQPYLQIENVHKKFGEFVALRDIYLDVYPGEFVCLLGPSGCGKTTLLRIIAGLEQQTSGRIVQAEKDVSRLPPSKRDFGIVFQSYALARALALSPGLLLLDEPLSALDAKVRVKLRTEITQLQKQLGVTAIMVTHDQAEALAMGDRIVVMDKGYIAQVGTPKVVYQKPNTPFVANFIGIMNFLSGVVINSTTVQCGNLQLQTSTVQHSPNDKILIAIRPEDIHVLHESQNSANLANVLTAEIENIEFLGSVFQLLIRPDGDAKETLTCEVSLQESRYLDLSLNSKIRIQLPPDLIRVFPAENSP